MTLTYCYTTTTNLLIELKKQGDTATKTTNILELAINRASRFIDQYTGKIYYTKSLTAEKVDVYSFSLNGLYIDPIRRNRIEAPAPILTITSFSEDGQALTVNSDYYFVVGQNYIIKEYNGQFSAEHQAISITGTMGYAATPSHIEHVCLAISGAISGMSAQILTDENGDSVAVVRNSVPKWCMDILDKEKRRITA